MRKSIDQLWRESLDEESITRRESDLIEVLNIEVLNLESGDEVRGGDRPYVPMIYESTTKRNRFTLTTFLDKIGF